MNAVEVASLAKRFGETVALDGLTFSVLEGEIFGLVGPTANAAHFSGLLAGGFLGGIAARRGRP